MLICEDGQESPTCACTFCQGMKKGLLELRNQDIAVFLTVAVAVLIGSIGTTWLLLGAQ
jgi:hypothetical protein